MSSGGPPPLAPLPYPPWLGSAKEKPPGRGRGGRPPMGAEPTGPPHELPAKLVEGLARAWGQSFPEGRRPALKVQEQGGILVRRQDGTLDWKRGEPLPIDAKGDRSFKPNYQDLGPAETL